MPIQNQNIWSPKLLSALGAGFTNDATLHDGIHLRWTSSADLGLPIRHENQQIGRYKIDQLKPYNRANEDVAQVLPIRSISLFEDVPLNLQNFIKDGQDIVLNPRISGEENPRDGYYFRKFVSNTEYLGLNYFFIMHSALEWKLQTTNQSLNERDQSFVDYLYRIHEKMSPEIMNSLNQEICEAVAVDMSFNFLNETAPGDAPLEQQGGCMGAITGFLRALPEQKYAQIFAYNRKGEIIDSDWVGRKAVEPGSLNQNRTKNIAKLRGSGIYYVKIKQVPGVRIAQFQDGRFLLCQDYCRADVWRKIPGATTMFRTDEDGYQNDMIEHYYKPFKQAIDVDSISNFMLSDQMIGASHFENLVNAPNTYEAFQISMGKALDEENGAGNINDDEFSAEQLTFPFLASLVASSIEPALARVTGSYFYIDPSDPDDAIAPDVVEKEMFFPKNGQTDFRIQGTLPFFDPNNLDQLRDRFMDILSNYEIQANRDRFLDFYDPFSFESFAPCGLVLAPDLDPKPAPEVNNFQGFIGTTAVPDRNNPDTHELIVNSNLIIPSSNSEKALEPWEKIIAFNAKRKINNGPYVDTSAEEANVLPMGIGILPAVKMSDYNEDNGTYSMRDFFFLALDQGAENLSYRVNGYDIFGRPSPSKDGGPFSLPIPCFKPQKPMNLHTQIDKVENKVTILSTFSIITKDRIVDADATHLEILIYRLPENSSDGAMGTRWVGDHKGMQIRYAINNDLELDLGSEEIRCTDLHWDIANNADEEDQLVSNPVAQNQCDLIFPDGTTSIEAIESLPTETPDSVINGNNHLKHYQLRFFVASENQMDTGEHFYAVAMRVLALCSNEPVRSGDIISGSRLYLPPPPPELIQPPLTRVPLSTYPDKKGQSYYQIDLLSCFVPIDQNGQPQGAVPLDDTVQLRIYHSTLDKLDKDLSGYVDGDYYVEENGENVLDLVRSDATAYELMTAVPLTYAADIRHHKIHVNGNLQKYHVIAVEGVTKQLRARPWKYCAFFVFKTPTPFIPPAFVQIGTNLYLDENEESVVETNYIATFPEEVLGVLPKIQVMRFDRTLDTQAFIAEEIGQLLQSAPEGVDLPTGVHYSFNIVDKPTIEWHLFNYEATLLYGSPLDDTYIKHPQKSEQETSPVQTGNNNPFEGRLAEQLEVGGNLLYDFYFAAGEYRVQLKVLYQDDSAPENHFFEIRQGRLFHVDDQLDLNLEKNVPNNEFKIRIQNIWEYVSAVKLIFHLSSNNTASNTIEL